MALLAAYMLDGGGLSLPDWLEKKVFAGMEKKTVSQILVQASDFEDAVDKFKEGMKGSMADYVIVSISETMIMDVFPANLNPGN